MIRNRKRRVTLITGHYLESDRKAGFHWLADACHRRGDEVLFFTACISWLSRLKNDHRFRYPILTEKNRMIEKRPDLWSFVWYTPLHPVNLRIPALNWASKPVVGRYADWPLGESLEFLESSDLIIFESTPAIMLFSRIKNLNPSARVVYRVSDDLAFLKNHPLALAAENRWANDFDLVSVPFRSFLQKFPDANCRHHLHGIRKDVFESAQENPYGPGTNAVFVGVNFFDRPVVEMAAELRPDWNFHIIGPFEKSGPQNIHWHGERPFDQTVPFVKFADIGLLNLVDVPGSSYFTDTLKTIQYSYCGLPIIAPRMLKSDRNNFFYYQPGDRDSIDRALTEASEADRSTFSQDGIRSWDEMADLLG